MTDNSPHLGEANRMTWRFTQRSTGLPPSTSQGSRATVHHMFPNQLPTWRAPDVVADDLNNLANQHRQLGITPRDARALRRVARLITMHDEQAERRVAS